MVVFSERDRSVTHEAYRDVADAVAAAIVRRDALVGTVHVAAYSHRFGIDITAHATHDAAVRRLADVITRECARDPGLRELVVERFGGWPAQQLDPDTLESLVESWTELAEGEALWIVECDVCAGSDSSRGVTVPHPSIRDEEADAADPAEIYSTGGQS